jgi:hypothetical protein
MSKSLTLSDLTKALKPIIEVLDFLNINKENTNVQISEIHALVTNLHTKVDILDQNTESEEQLPPKKSVRKPAVKKTSVKKPVVKKTPNILNNKTSADMSDESESESDAEAEADMLCLTTTQLNLIAIFIAIYMTISVLLLITM